MTHTEILPQHRADGKGASSALPAVPVNYGPANLPPEELAAVVYTERPTQVWIDLARRRVELDRPGRAPLAFLFSSAADAHAAGMAAEMARRQLDTMPARPTVGERLRQRGVRR